MVKLGFNIFVALGMGHVTSMIFGKNIKLGSTN